MTARGIPCEKITIIPNAVDREAFAGPETPDRALAARLGLIGKTVLAFFGSFYFYEGLHLLLRALPLLRQRQADLAVLFVGGGPEESNLRRMARDFGVGGDVVFAGRVAHEEMQRYYDLADLFVFPRVSMRLTERVTPLKPLEAMAQEGIVVASSVGGHRELIRDRETGRPMPVYRNPDFPRLPSGLACLFDTVAEDSFFTLPAWYDPDGAPRRASGKRNQRRRR
jgi:glycogen synthase